TVRASWWTSSPAPGNSGPRVTPVKPGGERSVKGRSAAGDGTGDRAATKHRYRRSSPRNH
ncbi:unnamed protein product, partial [Ectocarpus fasciculatus]